VSILLFAKSALFYFSANPAEKGSLDIGTFNDETGGVL